MQATIERGWKVKTANCRREELLTKITANREKHTTEYREACELYRNEVMARIDLIAKEVVEAAKKKAEWLTTQDVYKPAGMYVEQRGFNDLQVPTSHEKDYTAVIEMLKMEVEETIKLTSDEFACYVLDDWDWKKGFESVSNFYKMSSANATRGK